MRTASGFAFIALRNAAVEAVPIDEEVQIEFVAAARKARMFFKAVLPDPAAASHQSMVAVIRVVAEALSDSARGPLSDLRSIADAVDALLDRSVGAEE